MKRLDQHRAFPVVAWVVIIGFAFFTYDLTKRVSALENSWNTSATEASVNDLDRYFE